MNKNSLQNYLAKSSLNITFVLIILLSSLFPLILSLFLLISNYEHERLVADQTNIVVKDETKIKLTQLLKEIQSELKVATQKQTVIDLLNAPKNIRSFIENRAYGSLSETQLNSKVPFEFALLSTKENEIIFHSKFFNTNFLSSKNASPVSSMNNTILLYDDIRFDDQDLKGPNAKIKGAIIASIKISALQNVVPKLKRIINLDNLNDVDVEIYEVKNRKTDLILTTALIFISLFASIALGLLIFQRRIISPLKNISQKLQTPNRYEEKNEISTLETVIENYFADLKTKEHEKSEKEKLMAANLIASQVAHDIRSPLTALNIVIGTIDKLPEDKRILVRNAIQRINDIANDLLARGKTNSSTNLSSDKDTKEEVIVTTMLSSLIDMLISEKRTQYRNKIDVQIGAELSNSYGLFSKIPANEFKRVLSNLINNSVEALENGKGKVFTTLDDNNEFIKIEIVDNGKGIPPDIIEKLGAPGVSFGKEGTTSGSGLGIHHAIKFISSIGGKIEFINNTLPETGVTVTILIPKSQPPIWFVKQVEIPLNGKLVALDDDQSIHSLWQGRLSSLKASEKNISLFSFTSAEIFKTWVLSQNLASSDTVFLVDYELLGQKTVGLDIIEELGIQKNSILVSSRYDEKNVYERCKRLGVKIIPKAMAGLVPIEIGSKAERIDAILIDDDSIVHMTWKISATQSGKKFVGFKNYNDFLKHTNEFNLSTAVVIDLHLEDGVDGSLVAQHVFNLGFKNIFIGTGKAASEVPEFPWIKGVIGKAPIWDQFE